MAHHKTSKPRKESKSSTSQDYWRELEELQQLSSTLLNDLEKLRLDPSISSSTRNMRKIDKIIAKTDQQIEVLRKWHARQHVRHRHKHTPAPWPDTDKPEKINPIHYQQMKQFTSDVLDVIDRGQELHLPIQKKPSKHQHESWCQRSHSHVVPTIEHWQDQLMSYRSTKTPKPDHVKMVAHFQKLFDVPMQEGIYARMNDVYVRLAEMQNIYRSLKTSLGLREGAPTSSIVGAVNRLCELHSGTTGHLLSELIQEERLDGLITKLEHYHKFYPVFDGMARELMMTLGVSSMSQVVPAVKAMKLLNP